MKRHLLAAAVASAPLLAAAAPALAQVTISNSTSTPVTTATANNGQPSDVIVSGSIGLTAPGTALTLNSNNNVNITGSLGATDQDNTFGLVVLGGFTGSAVNQGTINITESYTAPVDPNNDGLYTGAFAQGTNRIGLEVTNSATFPGNGSGVFTGNNETVATVNGNITVNGVTNVGTITVNGNSSYGVLIAAPVVGNYMSLTLIPATSSTTAPITAIGTIAVVGQDSVGLEIAPTGSINCAASGCSKGDGVGGAGSTGNMRIGVTSATGPGAQGVVLDGNVGGSVNVEGSVSATGYRTTTRQTNPFISIIYSQMEMQQGGSAMTVGGNIGGGLIVSAMPIGAGTSSAYSSNTYADLDNDGVPDVLQGTGAVIAYGSSPALQVGSATGNAITLGLYSGSNYVSLYNGATGPTSLAPTGQFGLVIQGSILGEGLFDQLTSPYLLNPASATALQIGGPILVTPEIYTYNSNYQPTSTTPTAAIYGASGAVDIKGGVYNSGTIAAYAYQADATAIHVGYNATVPTIYNDGTIYASSTQVNSALTPTPNSGGSPTTPAPVAVNVVAIQIGDPVGTQIPTGAAQASVTTITNNSGIFAELTGTGGVGGTTKAIVDYTGSLTTINNSGSIEALLNQTSVSQLMPTNIEPLTATAVAIDMHYGTTAQTITQTAVTLPANIAATVTAYVATSSYTTLNTVVTYEGNLYRSVASASPGYDPIDYPQYWQEIGAVSPSITGDIYMGSANDTLNISAGTVSAANITMGAETNTINVLGTGVTNALGDTGFVNVTGAISEQAGGTFVINVNHGQLNDLNPQLGQAAKGITIGSTGVLEVTADPLHSQNTQFHITGSTPNSANIASGGQIGLIMASLQTAATQNYTIMYGLPGTISAPSLSQTALGFTPYLYTATASYVASASASTAPGAAPVGDNEITLAVDRKTAAQLGFNAAEASAYDPILNSLQQSTSANQGIQQALLAQTSQAGLKSVYDQLLPNQGQGIFEALDAAVEKVSALTATPPDNATHVGGASMWLQEVNERVDRTGIDTLGSDAQVLGLVGGYERMGAAGGAVGVTLAYFNAQESDTAAQLGAHDLASLVEAGVYYRRSIGGLTLSARAGGGYGWFSGERVFAYGTILEQAQANWTGAFIDGHLGASYEFKLFGPYYARPEVSIDYLRLAQSGYQENGADSAFNLAVASQTDTQFTGQAIMTLGRQWGRAAWFRTEVRFGYRAVIDGSVGDTTANFLNGTPFTLVGDPDKGGWATVGFSLKTGSEFSYLALEGDADLRRGEQRYDLRVAGRSVF